MCADHLQEWIWEHLAGEVARDTDKKTADSDPEVRERKYEDRGEDEEEDRELTKWYRVVELFQTVFRDDVLEE